jgi:hypothetical protein
MLILGRPGNECHSQNGKRGFGNYDGRDCGLAKERNRKRAFPESEWVDKTIGFAASMRNGARELSGAVSKKPDR